MDTSIPRKKIIMRLPAAARAEIPAPVLPAGFTFHAYTDGGAGEWARIETAVGEFPTIGAARDYFEKVFLAHPERARAGVMFVRDPGGTAVATASLWHAYLPGGIEVPCLHWVATHPDARGLGLGRAVSLQALSLAPEGRDVVLSTQTWSHPAVRMYHRLGFHVCRSTVLTYDAVVGGAAARKESGNDYTEAMEVLAGVLDAGTIVEIRRGSRA